MKFCLQAGESTREKTAIYTGARKLGYEVTSAEHCPPDCIPIGTVEFCEAVAPEKSAIKNFYPLFLKRFLHRRVSQFNVSEKHAADGFTGHGRIGGTFIKRADAWKSDFESSVYGPDEAIPPGAYYFSSPVVFEQEWRYYVANGVVVCSGWYAGEDEDEPAPAIDVQWPSNYSGAVDFGRLEDGRIALVEAHAPFACGWYGEDSCEYTYWQAEAWKQWAKE